MRILPADVWILNVLQPSDGKYVNHMLAGIHLCPDTAPHISLITRDFLSHNPLRLPLFFCPAPIKTDGAE